MKTLKMIGLWIVAILFSIFFGSLALFGGGLFIMLLP